MSKKLRLILVANSVPVADTDFLKDKVFGLSQYFDLHFLCWGKKSSKEKFLQKFGDKLGSANVHLFYNKWSTLTFLRLLLLNGSRLLLYPSLSIKTIYKMLNLYQGDKKKAFIKFSLYFPILRLNPDIVHFEFGTLAHTFSDLKQFVHCKASVSFRGYDINFMGLDIPGYYQDVWSNFDGFHFLGNDLKERAIRRGYTGGKVEMLIPPAIDTTMFTPTGNRNAGDKLVIISVGRLTWKKGYEYALQALAVLKQKGYSFEYRIVGDGNHRQAIQFAVTELGLVDVVVLLGALNKHEVQKELDNAHVFLHPAVSEGFCNAVIEAQAMALPVIATNADGLAENIKDGITGFIVPVYNAPAIAEKLEWCFANKNELPAMGKEGVKRVQQYFKIEEQVEKFKDFYTRLHAS
jgi:colanic acid/amylovoran biosynthesis glycosyltransferase